MTTKPLAGLTASLQRLLKWHIGITVLAVMTGAYEYQTYSSLPAGVNPEETVLACDWLVTFVGFGQLVVNLWLLITFARWIHRTSTNLHAFSGETLVFSPRWSLGWYFVPIANLVKPYESMKEIWRVSHKESHAPASFLGIWWGLWIISNLVGRIASKMLLKSEGVELTATAVMALSNGIDIALAIVALLLVTRIGAAYAANIVERSEVLSRP